MLALISVACWAWYALRNARWLRENPDKHPMMGNGAGAGYAAGLVNRLCGGLSVAEYPETAVYPALWPASRAVYRSDDRHRGAVFRVGALCWNIASQKLPTVILGPLIVFETLAGLLYTFILRRKSRHS